MAAAIDEFSVWLGNKLQSLNTDENVFGSYITAILDGDESVEEKTEAISELLTEIIESDINLLCKEIIEKWQKAHQKIIEPNASCSSEDVDTKLVRLLESQCLATAVQKEYTAEEKKIRDAILSQYSQMTDDEDEVDEKEPNNGDSKVNALERNTNAQAVQQAEKEKREQAKLDSQKKKDKDKEDREKQKQLKEEKKEKRKTQKGERRR